MQENHFQGTTDSGGNLPIGVSLGCVPIGIYELTDAVIYSFGSNSNGWFIQCRNYNGNVTPSIYVTGTVLFLNMDN